MKQIKISRANPQIWRIAEWLWSKRLEVGGWYVCGQNVRDYYYDVAKELNYMFLYNAFASKEDLHND